MKLHTTTWGSGPRVAVLLHGMQGSAQDWWEVAPALVARGYRVVGVDLPGHGASPPVRGLTAEAAAELVLDAVPAEPELAMGHSMGGLVLAGLADELHPARTVYVESPFTVPAFANRLVLSVAFKASKRERTVDNLAREHPRWSDHDREVTAAAARAWDVATSVSLCLDASKQDLTPDPSMPALLVLAEASEYVPEEEAARLAALGFEVRVVPGAEHSVWFGALDPFLAALDGWI